jgi:hypothetical protein
MTAGFWGGWNRGCPARSGTWLSGWRGHRWKSGGRATALQKFSAEHSLLTLVGPTAAGAGGGLKSAGTKGAAPRLACCVTLGVTMGLVDASVVSSPFASCRAFDTYGSLQIVTERVAQHSPGFDIGFRIGRPELSLVLLGKIYTKNRRHKSGWVSGECFADCR